MKKNLVIIITATVITALLGVASFYPHAQYVGSKKQMTDDTVSDKSVDKNDKDAKDISKGEPSLQSVIPSKVEDSVKQSGLAVSEPSVNSIETQIEEPSTESTELRSEGSFSEIFESTGSEFDQLPSETTEVIYEPESPDSTGFEVQDSSGGDSELSMELSSGISDGQSVKPLGKVDISDCRIVIEDAYKNDKTHTPKLDIYHNGYKLVHDRDYISEFEYMPNGKKYFKVTMLGKYEGSLKQEYSILPTATTIYRVSPKVSDIELRWLDSSKTSNGYEIGISENSDMSDETVYTVEGGKATRYNISDLVQNKVYYLRIRSYKNSDDGRVKICSAWSSVKTAEMKKVEVINGVTYIDGILIANKTYSLPENYGSGLDKTALAAFNKMAADAGNDGLYLFIVSGFRSYQVQDSTYSYFCSERGVSEADRVSARPGHSEHQTGLAMDINSTAFSFADTPEAKWLADNCWRYGFVIRYPQGKEDITGYAYEAWHIRYLGKELAKELYESGLTLEEYLGITSQYN